MSYLKKASYKIIPKESYRVLHNCPGCGCKSEFVNTNTFRVNANGNAIDVWLIYQCETCKHTLNLTIYERQNPNSIPQELYQQFLSNDPELCRQYGMDKSLFARNKKRIDLKNVPYLLEEEKDHEEDCKEQQGADDSHYIDIKNEYGLKIRMDKMVSSLLHMTRSEERKAEQEGIIRCNKSDQQNNMRIYIKKELCTS